MTKEAMIRATVARLRHDLSDLLRFVKDDELPDEILQIRDLIKQLQSTQELGK
jgi:HEPN domain-containing protein